MRMVMGLSSLKIEMVEYMRELERIEPTIKCVKENRGEDVSWILPDLPVSRWLYPAQASERIPELGEKKFILRLIQGTHM